MHLPYCLGWMSFESSEWPDSFMWLVRVHPFIARQHGSWIRLGGLVYMDRTSVLTDRLGKQHCTACFFSTRRVFSGACPLSTLFMNTTSQVAKCLCLPVTMGRVDGGLAYVRVLCAHKPCLHFTGCWDRQLTSVYLTLDTRSRPRNTGNVRQILYRTASQRCLVTSCYKL